MSNKRSTILILPILIIAVIAVAIFVYVLFPRNDGISDYDPCKNWIAAMEKQDMEGAIRAANLIVGDKKIISRNSPIFEHCINDSNKLGVNKYFIISFFNRQHENKTNDRA